MVFQGLRCPRKRKYGKTYYFLNCIDVSPPINLAFHYLHEQSIGRRVVVGSALLEGVLPDKLEKCWTGHKLQV